MRSDNTPHSAGCEENAIGMKRGLFYTGYNKNEVETTRDNEIKTECFLSNF
jgi:hypothetical protein